MGAFPSSAFWQPAPTNAINAILIITNFFIVVKKICAKVQKNLHICKIYSNFVAKFYVRMKIQFLGATREVTGSKHLITTDSGHTILLDCGMYQGK